jgi:serine/threonine-protein kinase
MAELFLAQQPPSQELVVIKRILPYLSEEPEFVQMFLDEARIAAQLHHPNVVQVHELGRLENTIFIAMEYVEGIDLRRVVAEEQKHGSTVPYGVAARVCAQVAAGLDHAHHSRGVDGRPLDLIHRDVSPQNVMVAYDGRVKLVDFGIAKAQSLAERSKPGVIKGKFLYLSPEQVGQERLDGRSDIFALGVMLYEITTGRGPFARPTTEAILYAIRFETPPAPHLLRTDYPQELSRIVMKCLAKDRNQRYPRASALQADLEAFLASGALRQSDNVAAYIERLLGHEEERTVLHIPPAPAGRVEATQPLPSGLTARPTRRPSVEAMPKAPYDEPDPATLMTRASRPERSSPRAAPLPPPPEEGESTVQERKTRPPPPGARPPVPLPVPAPPPPRPSASLEPMPSSRGRKSVITPSVARRPPPPVEDEASESISLTPPTAHARPRMMPTGRRDEEAGSDTISQTDQAPRHLPDPDDDESTAGYDSSPDAPPRRRTGLLVAVAVFVVLAAVGGAAFWVLHGTTPRPAVRVVEVPQDRPVAPPVDAKPATPPATQVAPAEAAPEAPGSTPTPPEGAEARPGPDAALAQAEAKKDEAPADPTAKPDAPADATPVEEEAVKQAPPAPPAMVKVRFTAPRGTALSLGKRSLKPNTVLELPEGTHDVSFKCPRGYRPSRGTTTYTVEAGGTSPQGLKVECAKARSNRSQR